QFQRHRRRPPPIHDRRCRRLAARYLDGRFRSELSGAAKGLEFLLFTVDRMSLEFPVRAHGFQVQQTRWAKGLTQGAMKLLPKILKSNLPWRVKAEAFFHLTP